MLTDIKIAANHKLVPIVDIASKVGIKENELELYGRYKAKLNDMLSDRIKNESDGKLILVTAINPTPAGEGKTTMTIGLGQAMQKIGKKAIIALREPSMGPVFGMKGGATGGGYSQVLPMEDINLHFTGDMHAITSANNLLCALIDNHIFQGNKLSIDVRKILVNRCVDMNDRALRHAVIGIGGKMNGVPREDGFVITVASEVMAILCLAENIVDLKDRLGNMLIAYSTAGNPIYAKDLHAEDAMTILLKDAFMPNLVQTIEGTPAIIHGGPFANIAHGCNSVKATKLALKLADYCITEAGFGSDLGAEKFFDIKCQIANLVPSAVVLVATVRALKYNGNGDISKGIANLGAHIENMKKFKIPVVVAINQFQDDTEEEISYICDYCQKFKVSARCSKVYEKGGSGGIELAELLCETIENSSKFSPIYDLSLPIQEKIKKVATLIYGANDVLFTQKALNSLAEIEKLNVKKFPVCIAKTQYSLSDNPKLLGRPTNFVITIRDVKISHGAGFVVVYTGDIMTMPGLSKVPAAMKMKISEKNQISGLF